jgi:hypothetical protein
MKKVAISLKNCYGIKKLDYTFIFNNKAAYAIYAPNGVMKSSLAKTFQDAASGEPSSDRIFPTRQTVRQIIDENGAAIDGERVLVALPYDPYFGPTEKTATLLVDAKLRREYAQLHVDIEKAKDALLAAIRKQASSKRDFAHEVAAAFTNSEDFDLAVTRIRQELEGQKETPFAEVPYDIIFDDKVLKALDTKDLRDAVENYIKRYNDLLTASTYFKKGTFDYYDAGQIAKSLSDHGFFEAHHTVNLKATAGDILEIATQKELEGVINKEKEAILKDKNLRKTFDAVAKQLEKNAELREFYRYLQDHEALLSQMNNVAKFKEDVLKSYLKSSYELYVGMMQSFDAAAKRKAEIEEEARKQRAQWDEVIAIFNDRFFVPFRLEARNRIQVMLGDEQIINLGFTYQDGTETAQIEKPTLLTVLSTGERKALYILNVIFEVQRRMKAKQETLLVVDDIADSFDYQNKYAIIHYLKDISEDGLFKLIIMTHNFDFFRCIEGRFVGYSNCLMASKNKSETLLAQATGIRNVFANDWKKDFFTDNKKKIASIPFLRNLIEMTTGESDPNYLKLTSMLHAKPDSAGITIADLDKIFNALCKKQGASADAKGKVVDVVTKEADACLQDTGGLKLENKIVLAIGIRLAAERFVIATINDAQFVNSIASNQTQALIDEYRKRYPGNGDILKVLDGVALMTPENIHVNSFMYEPIVDMSDEHLKKLYAKVKKLTIK